MYYLTGNNFVFINEKLISTDSKIIRNNVLRSQLYHYDKVLDIFCIILFRYIFSLIIIKYFRLDSLVEVFRQLQSNSSLSSTCQYYDHSKNRKSLTPFFFPSYFFAPSFLPPPYPPDTPVTTPYPPPCSPRPAHDSLRSKKRGWELCPSCSEAPSEVPLFAGENSFHAE